MPVLFALPHGGKKQLIFRWNRLLHGLGLSPDVHFQILDDLLTRYSEPQRVYHNLTHIHSLFGVLPESSPALEFAVWFHDAVYDPTRADNEAQSAQLAALRLEQMGLPKALIDMVHEMVMATHNHQTARPQTQMLLDADLSILGSSQKVYNSYVRAIRLEYNWLPDEVFFPNRTVILKRFLDRPQIYHTPAFTGLEATARQNLTLEIESYQR